jgi:hypothetical protein
LFDVEAELVDIVIVAITKYPLTLRYIWQ